MKLMLIPVLIKALLILALGLFGIFLILIFPIWSLIHCIRDPKLSKGTKTAWVCLIIFTWMVGAAIYGLAASDRPLFKGLGTLVIAVAVGFLIFQKPILARVAKNGYDALNASLNEPAGLGLSDAGRATLKSQLATLDLSDPVSQDMIKLLLEMTRNHRLSQDNLNLWERDYANRGILTGADLKAQIQSEQVAALFHRRSTASADSALAMPASAPPAVGGAPGAAAGGPIAAQQAASAPPGFTPLPTPQESLEDFVGGQRTLTRTEPLPDGLRKETHTLMAGRTQRVARLWILTTGGSGAYQFMDAPQDWFLDGMTDVCAKGKNPDFTPYHGSGAAPMAMQCRAAVIQALLTGDAMEIASGTSLSSPMLGREQREALARNFTAENHDDLLAAVRSCAATAQGKPWLTLFNRYGLILLCQKKEGELDFIWSTKDTFHAINPSVRLP